MNRAQRLWILFLVATPLDLIVRGWLAESDIYAAPLSHPEAALTLILTIVAGLAALVSGLSAHRPTVLRMYVRLLRWRNIKHTLALRYSGIVALLAGFVLLLEFALRVAHLPWAAIAVSAVIFAIGAWRLRRDVARTFAFFKAFTPRSSEQLLRRRTLEIDLLLLLPVAMLRLAGLCTTLLAPNLATAVGVTLATTIALWLLRPTGAETRTTCRVCWRSGPLVALDEGLCLYGCGPEEAVLGRWPRTSHAAAPERQRAITRAAQQKAAASWRTTTHRQSAPVPETLVQSLQTLVPRWLKPKPS